VVEVVVDLVIMERLVEVELEAIELLVMVLHRYKPLVV
jgi:hypothetical protein